MDKPVSSLPVCKAKCSTCPFRENEEGQWQNATLAAEVIKRNLFKSQQICHGTEGKKRKARHRCKGYYDFAFGVYEKLGLDPGKNLINNPE